MSRFRPSRGMGSNMRTDRAQMEVPEYPDIAVPARDPGHVTCEIVRSENEFASLFQSWERLTTLSKARIYQTFDWQWTWWSHFGSGLGLHIVHTLVTQRLAGTIMVASEAGNGTRFVIELPRHLEVDLA